MNLRKVDYTDEEGIPRRVALPYDDTLADPQEGVPLSINLDTLYEDTSPAFRRRLMNELWNRGLIEPGDFLKPGAVSLVRSALLAAIGGDTMAIISEAGNQNKH